MITSSTLALLVCIVQTDSDLYPDMPTGVPPLHVVSNCEATGEEEMKPYTETIPGTEGVFGMTPIPSGTFQMGSPGNEKKRNADEGPRHAVFVDAFWIGTHEMRWDEYHQFMLGLDKKLRAQSMTEPVPQDAWADAVSRPTPPYVPMDFEMGVAGYPAVCMTQFAAKQFTKWLSMKTGRFYRLPTEAEWEYACRAGTESAYSFGKEPIDDYAWHYDNANDSYQKVGLKKPNPWGLYDIHGNVAEWVLDGHDKSFYGLAPADDQDGVVRNPLRLPQKLYPRVTRGGSWDDDVEDLRSASRKRSKKSWKIQDPQLPKSIWYHTDASFVGFRVVRPLVQPTAAEKAKFWDPDLDSIREIMERQRTGER